jgi:hypothetical protein
MVHGVSNFAMAPKAFFLSAAAEQFVCLYPWKDIVQLATEFESTILANGVILSESFLSLIFQLKLHTCIASAMNHHNRVSRAKASI